FLGLIGMPRRIYTYAPDLGWNFWNLVATIGALIIVLSFLVFLWNVFKTTRSGAPAPADPWDGRTLEWTIPSPPPVSNFAVAAVADNPNIGCTGLDHRKMGMWAFLGSECMFFGSLIGTYLSYKGKSINGPGPHEILNIPLTSLSAFVLLMSSLLMVLALAAVQRNDMKWAKIWLFMTALFGSGFVGFQC